MLEEVDDTVEGLYQRVNIKGKVYLACALIIRDAILELKG